jgi:outer membrane protein TolC
MNPFSKITNIALTLLIAGTVVAADIKETVSLDQLMSAMFANNPDIQAAQSRYFAAETRPSQMRTLPDPVVSFVSRNGDGNPLPFTEVGKDPLSSIGLMWQQEFPYPGKLKLAGEIAEKEADAARANIDTVKWNKIADLKQAFYEYFQTNKSIQILTDSLNLLRRFEEIANSRYSVGAAIQQDVLRSQVEISILNQRITSKEQERATAVAEINRLINRSMDAPLPPPAEITKTSFVKPLESVQAEFAALSPQIRSSEAMVAKEEKGVALSKKQYRPDFVTSVEYDNSPNFPDMWEIEFGLRIPIFYKSKQLQGEKEAVYNLSRSKQELRSMEQEIAFTIKNQYLQINASEKLLKLYDQAVLPQSNLALESSLASYQVGKSDFLTTLSNFLTLLEYRMNYYEELARRETAVAKLESMVGHSLVIRVETKGGSNHE